MSSYCIAVFVAAVSVPCAHCSGAVDPYGLRPLGRSFFSVDPEASADLFTKYLGAKEIPQNLTKNASCAEAAMVDFGGYPIMFVRDKVKRTGSIAASDAVASATEAWRDVAVDRKTQYNQWIDFHDGFETTLSINADRLIADNVSAQVYHDSVAKFPAGVIRLGVPGTAWTLEEAGELDMDKARKMERYHFADPDNCRNNSVSPPISGLDFWWKATYSAADPAAATEFAVNVLGAEEVASPYPWPPKTNCTIAKWVIFRKAKFMLHFVSSPEYGAGTLTVHRYAKYQENLRDLRGRVFDQHMYNNLVLWTDDLDIFVANLQKLDVPFLAYSSQDQLFSVFVDIPGNGIVIQVRGAKLTVVEAELFDACETAAHKGEIFV